MYESIKNKTLLLLSSREANSGPILIPVNCLIYPPSRLPPLLMQITFIVTEAKLDGWLV